MKYINNTNNNRNPKSTCWLHTNCNSTPPPQPLKPGLGSHFSELLLFALPLLLLQSLLELCSLLNLGGGVTKENLWNKKSWWLTTHKGLTTKQTKPRPFASAAPHIYVEDKFMKHTHKKNQKKTHNQPCSLPSKKKQSPEQLLLQHRIPSLQWT